MRNTYQHENGIRLNYVSRGKWQFKKEHNGKEFSVIYPCAGLEVATKMASVISGGFNRVIKKTGEIGIDGLCRANLETLN